MWEIRVANQAEEKVDIKAAICESYHPSTLSDLLVPTVSNGEHPLVVDKHTTAEVVSVVKGGHERTGVRLALPSANDLAIPAGNCRNCTHTQNRQGQQEKTVTQSDHLWCRRQCDQVSVHASLPAAPISSSRASSLMVPNEQSEDTWTHLTLALYASTTPPSICNSFFFFFVAFFSCWPHLCQLTLFPLGTKF